MIRWKDAEPSEGVFDWSRIDDQLELVNRLGKKTSVQINATNTEFPDWLFDQVARCTRDKRGRTMRYPQFWDPIFMEKYTSLLNAFGDHLKSSPYKENELLVRQNWNMVSTEQNWLNSSELPVDCESTPSGHIFDVPYSDEVALDVQRAVVDAYEAAFLPDIHVGVRTATVEGAIDPIIRREHLTDGTLDALIARGFWFVTTSMSTSLDTTVGAFTFNGWPEFVRTGQAIAYSEGVAELAGLVRLQNTPSSLPQVAYWSVLFELHLGATFLGYRTHDLANPDLRFAWDFANKYAGFHAKPATAPGAWVALRPRTVGQAVARFFPDFMPPGNYNMHMQQIDQDNTSVALAGVGPTEQKEGL